jgi:hypothetical protein
MPSKHDYERALRAFSASPDPNIRKEVLLQLFRYAAAWNDLDQLFQLHRMALSEHQARWPSVEPFDVEWLLAECLTIMGRPHEALEHLPEYGYFPLTNLHLDAARASALIAIGDLRNAGEFAKRVQMITAESGYCGPEEQRVLTWFESVSPT